MKTDAHVVLAASARLMIPVAALFALTVLAVGEPGAGVGMRAGLAFALALALHALVFGVSASRRGFAPAAARTMLALGALLVFAAAGAPGWSEATRLMELGLFGVVVSSVSLILTALMGRAPTLRDGE